MPRKSENLKTFLKDHLVIKCTLHIRRQAGGPGVGIERGEKGLQVLRDHVVEHRAAGVPGCVKQLPQNLR